MAATKGLPRLQRCISKPIPFPISYFSDYSSQGRKTPGVQQLYLGCKQSSRKSSVILRAGIAGNVGQRDEGSSDGKRKEELKESEWLRQELAVELLKGGLGEDMSRQISDACADGCEKFMRSRHGTFDPMMIMDAIEEEVERRDLRGDFLPFEIGRKATKLLAQRWVMPSSRPSLYREAFDNKLDVVDFERFPKPPPGC